jgi:esterase/lipase superfamily enzyme
VGELAASLPFYVPSEQRRVRVAESQSPAAFWEGLVAAARGTASGSAVLFVHGYSNGFERGCRMAAEVQRALEGQATVLLFSWPSSGNPLEYSRDQAAVEWSVPLLAETVEALGVLLGPGRTRILAHSLGSRGAIFALEWLEGSVAAPAVGELVLLAPDFDAQSFRSHLPRLARLAGGISLYASASDTPLKVSEQLHGAPRLGQGGALRTVVAGLETVDVSHAGGYPIMGHEYFYRHPRVLGDLARLLGTGERAGHRPQLTVRVQGGLPYWEILGWSAGP